MAYFWVIFLWKLFLSVSQLPRRQKGQESNYPYNDGTQKNGMMSFRVLKQHGFAQHSKGALKIVASV